MAWPQVLFFRVRLRPARRPPWWRAVAAASIVAGLAAWASWAGLVPPGGAGVALPVVGSLAAGPGDRPLERTLFLMSDPAGDDYGPGTYRYPTHDTFVPGLFDLTAFAVRATDEHVLFDLTFRAVNNPWQAPEGFFHQLVDIYIDTTPGQGRTDPLFPGPRVRFDPRYAWDVHLRAAPFGGSRLARATGSSESGPMGAPGRASASDQESAFPAGETAVKAGLLPDGRTIRLAVPVAAIGVPQPSWRYYVLVGGFDAFGEDGYRAVAHDETEWLLGGGPESGEGPYVIDVLAGRWWPSQRRMLGSFGVQADGKVVYATLRPAAPGRSWLPAAACALALVLAAVAGVSVLRRRS